MTGNTRLYEAVRALATMDRSAKERMDIAIMNLKNINKMEHSINDQTWKKIENLLKKLVNSDLADEYEKNSAEILGIWLETMKET